VPTATKNRDQRNFVTALFPSKKAKCQQKQRLSKKNKTGMEIAIAVVNCTSSKKEPEWGASVINKTLSQTKYDNLQPRQRN
jgi:hypothetical protein